MIIMKTYLLEQLINSFRLLYYYFSTNYSHIYC